MALRKPGAIAVAIALAISILEASVSTQASPESPRQSVVFEGTVSGSESFTRPFGPDFEFKLTAHDGEWSIGVYQRGRTTDLTQMTMPWRGPNATTIMGWHFLPAANAPSTRRSFMFSPEVGDTITWDMVDPRAANIEVTTVHALLDRIEAFGRGEMLISDYKLANVPPASSADAAHDVRLLSLTFRIVLSWPANYKAR